MRGRLVLAGLLVFSVPTAGAMLPQQRDPRAVVAPAHTGTGSISGVVTDSRQLPLPTVIVRMAFEGAAVKRETVTDAAGRFWFGHLPAGRVQISAHKAGYLDEWLGRTSASELLALGPGQTVADVKITLMKTGAISGTITGEAGEPIRASVRLLPRNTAPQLPLSMGGIAGTQTDGRGRYRIGSVPPGEYVVSALSLENPDARTVGPDGRDREFRFVETYFPGSLQPRDAAPVRVNEGNVVNDINIQLISTPSGTAEGQLTHVSGLPVQGQQVAFMGRDRIRFSALPMDGGRFRIAGLAYGEYEVVASGAVRTDSASMQVGWARGAVVIGPDRAYLALTLAPGAAITGRVSAEDGASTSGIKVRVTPGGAVPTAITGSNAMAAPVSGDGAFALANLAPGSYLLSVEMPPKSPLSIDRIVVAGHEVQNAMVELAAGLSLDGVEVALIDTQAEISGTVTASDGTPLAGVTVFALPERGFFPGSRTLSVKTDAAGRYVMSSVAKGRYLLDLLPLPATAVAHTPAGGSKPDRVPVVIDARGQKKVVDFRR